MVPGSTLMYGSNFCIVTPSPRSTNSRPNEAAAMPFPREETTPPVTKMYLVALGAEVIALPLKCVPMGFRPSKVVRRIHARLRRLGQPRDTDAESLVERPELLQPLGLLGRTRRGRHPPGQRGAGVHIDPQVLPVEAVGRIGRLATVGDGRP